MNNEGDNYKYLFEINISEGSYQVRWMDTVIYSNKSAISTPVGCVDTALSQVFDFHNDEFDVESPNYHKELSLSRRDNLSMHFSEKGPHVGIKSMLLRSSRSNETIAVSVVERLGVIGCYVNSSLVSSHSIIRQLKDEASCLRVLGCSLIVLLASGSYIFEKYSMIAQHTRGYIDAIIVYMPKNIYNEKVAYEEGQRNNESDRSSFIVPVELLSYERGITRIITIRKQADITDTIVNEVYSSDAIL